MQQLDTSMQLDENKAGSTNFIFRIGSTSSIRSIYLDILLKFIIFYVVLFNTSFLIYLADIDKLGVFFNNVTNQVIQLWTYIKPTRSYPVIKKNIHIFLP